MIKIIARYCVILLLSICCINVYSATNYYKFWLPAVITGSLAGSERFSYYLEPQLRLIDDPYVFNQFQSLVGLGYKINSRLYFYFGPGWVLTKVPQGVVMNEIRWWQQLNDSFVNTKIFNIQNRTRLEERINTQFPNVAYRVRERIWVRISFPWSGPYSFSCYDELFFNLNHPDWVSQYFFEQNRAFIGVSRRFSDSFRFDIGYLNQYFRTINSYDDHVFLTIFTLSLP